MYTDYLIHHGIPGMKWGVRRYQKKDGTRTPAGKRRRIIMDRETHYSRNALNTGLPRSESQAIKSGWHTVVGNAHQFTSANKTNRKYVSPDGKREAVYTDVGKLVKDVADMGSYNFSPSEISKGKHFVDDVLPWILYGNTPDDYTNKRKRVKMLLSPEKKGRS